MPPETLELATVSPSETQVLGEVLGRLTHPGDIILLSGPLGAGKTCFTQGMARGLGVSASTPSPTFMLAREYHGRLPLYHLDLYRLEFNEIAELGLEEYLYGEGVSVVEWAEKDPGLMTSDHLLVEITYTGEASRLFHLRPQGARYIKLLAELQRVLDRGNNRCTSS